MITAGACRASIAVGLAFALCAVRVPARADDGTGRQGMAVSVVKAEQRCFKDQLAAFGTLVPKTEVKVWAERGGLQVGQILVEAGDTVGAGQVLARLVDPLGALPQGLAIKSPASGVVVGLSAVIGSYASPALADPLFRIVVDDELEMRGQVLSSILSSLHVGQTARLQIIGFGVLDGHVAAIEPSIDPVTQLGAVRIAFAPDPRLRPGVFARAEIDAGEICAVTVPLSAVLYSGGAGVVQVVKGDHVETRRVEVGLLQGGLVQIQEGVDPGDVVIARAGSFLREGDRVRPIPQAVPKP